MEGLIYKAINSVMREIGAIGKNKRNTQGNGFMYRGIDDVMNALEPAMEKNGVFVVPEVLEQIREERASRQGGTLLYSICKIRYTFYAEDGSSVQATVIGEAMDPGDKATNKAMSVAFKYACFQVFCIPTEEMKDPDGETHEVNPNGKDVPKQAAKSSKEKADKPKESPADKKSSEVKATEVDAIKMAELNAELARTGTNPKSMLMFYKVDSIDKLTEENIEDAINRLKPLRDKKAGA
ncbi:ERF family protein [Lachnoclostridium phytofermentans]|uniref:ERF family protein n=1 Tax=Lachnoclostridium phytofermentans TaxID=66219 RepID=UPI00068A4EBA|nr:ERF family protein [Lachnoclostridium phytofermentans]